MAATTPPTRSKNSTSPPNPSLTGYAARHDHPPPVGSRTAGRRHEPRNHRRTPTTICRPATAGGRSADHHRTAVTPPRGHQHHHDAGHAGRRISTVLPFLDPSTPCHRSPGETLD